MSKRSKRCAYVLGLAASVFLMGCQGSGADDEVKGKVTLNGKAVAGEISFHGTDKTVSAPIGPDGSYTIKGAPRGKVKVSVKGFPGALAPKKEDTKIKLPKLDGEVKTTAATGVSPPSRYASPDNGLTYDVQGGKETKDFTLTAPLAP